ncbi:MAG: hypothetical protein U5K75_10460 [Ahrensia sp.]|nr:hypothetical protein [Ahrensia sp.]
MRIVSFDNIALRVSARLLSVIVVFSSVFFGQSSSAQAQLFETRAKQAVLLDVTSGSVLFAKEPDLPVPPASLAKLMTMEVVFNALKTGRLTLDDEFLASENAWCTKSRCWF